MMRAIDSRQQDPFGIRKLVTVEVDGLHATPRHVRHHGPGNWESRQAATASLGTKWRGRGTCTTGTTLTWRRGSGVSSGQLPRTSSTCSGLSLIHI